MKARQLVALVVVAVVVAAAVAVTQSGSDGGGSSTVRAVRVNLRLVGKLGAAGASGTVKGSPCNGGRFVSQVLPPTVNYRLTCPGGSLRLRATNRLNGSNVTGTWRTVSGTGRFKHARGSGRLRGSLVSGAPFVLTGTLGGI